MQPPTREAFTSPAKWVSSRREVLESIPGKDHGKDIKRLDFQKDELPVERALGVQWKTEDNTFGFDVNLKPKAPTRRGILSVVGSVFNLLGFVAPFILIGKKIFQDLWRLKLGWDDGVPAERPSMLTKMADG